MRSKLRLSLLILAALAPIALPAYAYVVRSFQVTTTSTSPFSGTAPSSTACTPIREGTSATGLWLSGCTAYYVCAEAASGQTLSGGGSLRADFWEEDGDLQWHREGLSDEIFDSTAASVRRFCFPARPLPAGTTGCAFFTPVSVTTSGGVTVITTARCIK